MILPVCSIRVRISVTCCAIPLFFAMVLWIKRIYSEVSNAARTLKIFKLRANYSHMNIHKVRMVKTSKWFVVSLQKSIFIKKK